MSQAALDYGDVPIRNGMEPAQAGECTILFLSTSASHDYWRLTSTDGKYVAPKDGALRGKHEDDLPGLVGKIEALTVTKLKREVQEVDG